MTTTPKNSPRRLLVPTILLLSLALLLSACSSSSTKSSNQATSQQASKVFCQNIKEMLANQTALAEVSAASTVSPTNQTSPLADSFGKYHTSALRGSALRAAAYAPTPTLKKTLSTIASSPLAASTVFYKTVSKLCPGLLYAQKSTPKQVAQTQVEDFVRLAVLTSPSANNAALTSTINELLAKEGIPQSGKNSLTITKPLGSFAKNPNVIGITFSDSSSTWLICAELAPGASSLLATKVVSCPTP